MACKKNISQLFFFPKDIDEVLFKAFFYISCIHPQTQGRMVTRRFNQICVLLSSQVRNLPRVYFRFPGPEQDSAPHYTSPVAPVETRSKSLFSSEEF